MTKAALKFEVGADDRGDGLVIEVGPEIDDGDDLIVRVSIRRPKPDKPRPRLQIVNKRSSLSEEDLAAAEAWHAHMMS